MYPILQEIPENLGFTYIDYGPEKKIEIKKNKIDSNPPSTLVKFYPLNKNSVNALKNQMI